MNALCCHWVGGGGEGVIDSRFEVVSCKCECVVLSLGWGGGGDRLSFRGSVLQMRMRCVDTRFGGVGGGWFG